MIIDVIHGLLSGLIWSAILGTCLIALAAVLTATLPPSARAIRSRASQSSTTSMGRPA